MSGKTNSGTADFNEMCARQMDRHHQHLAENLRVGLETGDNDLLCKAGKQWKSFLKSSPRNSCEGLQSK
jgi:hypothetical protein